MKEEIKVLLFCSGFIPSVIIGVLRPLLSLKKEKKIQLKIRLSRFNLFLKQEMDWCDVAIFCRNTEYSDLIYLYELKRLGKKVIYEIDDNFFEIPLDTSVGIYHRNYVRLYVLTRFLELADEVRVYSQIMEEICKNYNPNVSLINSYFDSKLVKQIISPKADSKIKIVYPTGRVDSPEIEIFLSNVIKRINLTHEDTTEFHFWGKQKPKYLEELNNIVMHKPILSYELFMKYFTSQGFDIGLAPLLEGRFYFSKTNNKYREFGGCQIAGIYPKLPPYESCVVHGENGILVQNNEDEWNSSLKLLIEDKELRKKIIKNAQTDILKNYSFENAREQLFLSIQDVFNQKYKGDVIPHRNRKIDMVFIGSNAEIFFLLKKEASKLIKLDKSIKLNISPQMIFSHQAQEYLKLIQNCDFCIFQIESLKELDELNDIFQICPEFVLDLSLCKNINGYQFNDYNRKLKNIIFDKTFEYDFSESNLSNLFRYVIPNFLPMTEECSLDGYRAVYFKLLDSIQGHAYDKGSNFFRVQKKVKSYYDICLSRVKRFALFFGYRIGLKN